MTRDCCSGSQHSSQAHGDFCLKMHSSEEGSNLSCIVFIFSLMTLNCSLQHILVYTDFCVKSYNLFMSEGCMCSSSAHFFVIIFQYLETYLYFLSFVHQYFYVLVGFRWFCIACYFIRYSCRFWRSTKKTWHLIKPLPAFVLSFRAPEFFS